MTVKIYLITTAVIAASLIATVLPVSSETISTSERLRIEELIADLKTGEGDSILRASFELRSAGTAAAAAVPALLEVINTPFLDAQYRDEAITTLNSIGTQRALDGLKAYSTQYTEMLRADVHIINEDMLESFYGATMIAQILVTAHRVNTEESKRLVNQFRKEINKVTLNSNNKKVKRMPEFLELLFKQAEVAAKQSLPFNQAIDTTPLHSFELLIENHCKNRYSKRGHSSHTHQIYYDTGDLQARVSCNGPVPKQYKAYGRDGYLKVHLKSDGFLSHYSYSNNKGPDSVRKSKNGIFIEEAKIDNLRRSYFDIRLDNLRMRRDLKNNAIEPVRPVAPLLTTHQSKFDNEEKFHRRKIFREKINNKFGNRDLD